MPSRKRVDPVDVRRIGGAILVLAGLLWAAFVLRGWEELGGVARSGNQGALVIAAGKAVVVRTLRLLPSYMGLFILIDTTYGRTEKPRLLGHTIVFVSIAVVCFALARLPGITCDALTYVLFLGFSFLTSLRMRGAIPHGGARAVLVALFIGGLHWLAVMPVIHPLSGRDPVSREIKALAGSIDAEAILNVTSLVFICFTLIVAALWVLLTVTHTRELSKERLARQQEVALQEARLALVKTTSAHQSQNLMHDLMTPLTTIQGLSSVLHLMVQANKQAATVAEKIGTAAEDMREKINDMMVQNRRQRLSVPELISLAAAQISPDQGEVVIRMNTENDLPQVWGNRPRLVRAFANLLENALQAIGDEGGTITISTRALPDHKVRIVIVDDGAGVPAEKVPHVFDIGYSTKGTAGLGLPSVGEIISDHRGTLHFQSVEGVGSRVVINLPEVIDDEP